MKLTIRDATAADEAAWLALWQSYLDFYAVVLKPEVTATAWQRMLDPAHRLAVRLAFEGEVLLGFATHHCHCSTWGIAEDCYLEDLFVADAARGKGVGRALIEDLKAIAKSKGCGRLYWHTDEGNSRARALYDSLVPSDGHLRYRLKL
jgi:GNAT superfamily N-acetyltransferase